MDEFLSDRASLLLFVRKTIHVYVYINHDDGGGSGVARLSSFSNRLEMVINEVCTLECLLNPDSGGGGGGRRSRPSFSTGKLKP